MKLLVTLVVCTLLLTQYVNADSSTEIEHQIISECLQRFGGLSVENSQRLQRYKQWSHAYEEIPCFTKCYISKMFDIYDETQGFREENVVKQFGQPVLNACKDRLAHGNDTCEMAYNGFHCLISLEDDPFILIESISKLDDSAKTAMKECLRRYDQYEWARVAEYSSFPVREPIPCYTKCFIDQLQLFSERTRQWNFAGMTSKLGLASGLDKQAGCRALSRRRTRNACAWMYQEFTCFAMSK